MQCILGHAGGLGHWNRIACPCHVSTFDPMTSIAALVPNPNTNVLELGTTCFRVVATVTQHPSVLA